VRDSLLDNPTEIYALDKQIEQQYGLIQSVEDERGNTKLLSMQIAGLTDLGSARDQKMAEI